eukprot:TRINITY_DN5057_c0_g4_i3.p1 TRINITY_DN5057_c0_g4~~TRINITY_DN5057_c0_g4_i3.p1  ORF type:complete len:506 (+),score=131.84 TRINITY_DN5057_c0_g4_i3:550-2067(+)
MDASDVFLGMMSVDIATVTLEDEAYWYPLQGRRGKNDVVSGEVCLSFDHPPQMQGRGGKATGPVRAKIVEAIKAGKNSLDLSGCALSDLPTNVFENLNWSNLDLSFNKFSVWPINLNMLENLQELIFSGCHLTTLGDDLNGLVNLRILSLNGNRVEIIGDSIGHLMSLEKLDLSNNEITRISPKIGNLRSLEELNLSGNQLQNLPPSFGKLEFLELLDLGSNKLIALPNEFPGMQRLLELNLANNELKKLPSDWGNMARMVNLNLSDNKLTDLPLSMGACVHLDNIILDRNPIKDQELLRKYSIGPDHLMDYLAKRLFAFNQDKKRRKREQVRRQEAARRLKNAGKEVKAVDNNGNTFFSLELEEEEDLTDEQKHMKIRGHSQKLCVEVKNELVTVKRALNNASTLEQIIPIAKAIRALIPHMNIARQQMAPIPKPNAPLFKGNEDAVTKLKKTTAVALREFESVWQGIFNVVCGNPTLEQLIALSGVITGSLTLLQALVKETSV